MKNPIEIIKKNVLMSESNHNISVRIDENTLISNEEKIGDKELSLDGPIPIERVIDSKIGSNLLAEEIIKIAKDAVESKFDVDLDNEKYKLYYSEDDIKESIDSIGSTKVSWYTNAIENPEFLYLVIITEKGEVINCEVPSYKE